MTVLKLINHVSGWSQCRCCGASYCVERAPVKYFDPWYIPRWAWGSFTRPRCGCTMEMLRAKLAAESRGRYEMLIAGKHGK